MVELSERRKKVLFHILPKVLGATFKDGAGDAKWTELGAGYNPTSEIARDKQIVMLAAKQGIKPKLGAHTTTCGSLPRYVAKQLGIPQEVIRNTGKAKLKDGSIVAVGSLQSGGTEGVRIAAKPYNAWRTHGTLMNAMFASVGMGADHRPLPGDFYALCSGTDPDNHIEHVGIVLECNGTNWLTADCGQGQWPDQSCIKVRRQYDPATCQLTGEMTSGLVRNKRLLCGWVDIDAYPFLT